MVDDELTPEQQKREDAWNREFGPDTDLRKRRIFGLLGIAAFIGFILWVVYTTPN
ncbi:MAG: hypothetical protein OQJ99_09290 [Rhodospirillales bacterium]|nr:hypothetical protein [Rhodospirillales bacterium]MCW8861553.1 hypothetical protein [Rhodospirillales bacterium]MCW8971418.1 hypothetical protein [Rhodospirillales bacterium]MCW9040494.1 hypothetical protein [Rhodospirillales bacterium]